MKKVKQLSAYFYFVLLLHFLVPTQAICDQNSAGGYNVIPIYVETKGGDFIIGKGAMMQIRNGKSVFVENDMIVNIGEFPIPVADFELSKGESAVVKGHKFVKRKGVINVDAWKKD